MINIIESINRIVWGIPALLMILGVGIYLCFQTSFVQFRLFPQALKSFLKQFRKREAYSNGISSYQALCTALAATVGTGNIAGVAGAIAIGGPGAIFWMWICAALGMVTKYAEATLAVRYRRRDQKGEYVGGPMYMINTALPRMKWLASLYSIFGVVAAFGVGNATQINAVIGGINTVVIYFGGNQNRMVDVLIGLFLAVLLLFMLLGGAHRIGRVAENFVPYAALGYLMLCLVILIARAKMIPGVIGMIFTSAFSPNAVTGGVVGSAFTALRVGASRGVFTNEAGMGTASIAHAASNVQHPVDQGLMGIMEVFLDTVVICTMTALVILCSGIPISYGCDSGIMLTTQAFGNVLGNWVCIPITVFLCCFAFATFLGWGLYGIRCAQYLFGDKAWTCFTYMQAVVTVVSVLLGTGVIWMIAETVNGLMAIPNLVVLAHLAPEVRRLTFQYTGWNTCLNS